MISIPAHLETHRLPKALNDRLLGCDFAPMAAGTACPKERGRIREVTSAFNTCRSAACKLYYHRNQHFSVKVSLNILRND